MALGGPSRVFPASQGYTMAEVAEHNTEESCWLVVAAKVYDISSFLRSHPGGIRIVLPHAGTDATEIFNKLHNPAFLEEYGDRYRIGHLVGAGAGAGEANGVRPTTRRADLRARPTPRLGKLFLSVDPRQARWPERLPKAARYLSARYVRPDVVLPLSLRPLGDEPKAGEEAGTGLHLLHPKNWLEVDEMVFAAEMAKKRKLLLEPENRWHNNVFAAEVDTMAEQQELLEVVIANILEHHKGKQSVEQSCSHSISP